MGDSGAPEFRSVFTCLADPYPANFDGESICGGDHFLMLVAFG
ncbi:hypothetical protein PRUPE_3G198100 [Prunus persica]|uniref:Uncharacterized protein n=1 Tax=Prunus persica TaxID=3760 RepID=A0A251Q2T8_PRUPE|nr:hypothetical protein PRUPE_3G198100 [Prunus persica]